MKELKFQLISALLLILTVAAVISAGINFQQQRKFRLPDDGVIWVDRPEGVLALHVVPGSQADKAGIRTGDILLKIDGVAVEQATGVAQVLVGLGAWKSAEYLVRRHGFEVRARVIIGEQTRSPALTYQYMVGAAYLVIGLFVFLRRRNATKAFHFYALCLASFVLCTFHYTGKLNNFDKVVYWGNVAAGLLAPTLFLHFALNFPEARGWFRGLRATVLYLPAGLLLAAHAGVSSGTVRVAMSLTELRWLLDRVWLAALCLTYLAAAAVLALHYRKADDPIVRQQLKWLRNGAFFGAAPFALFYGLPYALGAVPTRSMELSVLPLGLIPLTWAYALVRYRLMDVDAIFQQGYVYTLATLAVLGVFYALVLSVGKLDDLSPTAIAILIVVATFIFQPIRNWLQELLDRHVFYRDRYDYRRTLIEFARELSSVADLDEMLASVADRLLRTLSIQHLAFFLWDDHTETFRLRTAVDSKQRERRLLAERLDLSFLPQELGRPYLFIERTRHPLDVLSREWPASVRQSIAELDLTYYIPCRVRGRTIAYLGVSRTEAGDFLSSDDVELLVTLAGYVGIAIENSRLYQSLQRKVEEYERLKEFSENIVESINVGILAADLDDRVESWNTQMEHLTGIPREGALGRTLGDLFPEELCRQFSQVRGEAGIHHIYKFVLRPEAMPARLARSGSNGNEGSEGARPVTLNMAIAPLVSKDSQRIGRLIIFDDVTERAELERRLVQADKLSSIGLLAAGVAHEVNTPLAVISTYAQMLAKQVSGDEQKSQLLEKIAKQTFRASEIVNSLLNFSRTSPTDFHEVDLNRVIRETLNLIEHQLEKARIEPRLELEEDLPPIRGNASKLQQVLLNLILNARDAMEGGGTLTVRTWADNGHARIEVADTGQGIPAEQLSRIYDPFFTTKPYRKGTGLGLSVAYGIVKEHGGSIEVESRPRAGTRFRIELPVVRKLVNA